MRPIRGRRPSRRLGALMALGLVACAAVACTPDNAADTRAIEAAFPTLEELQVEAYSADCDYLFYGRGAFGSDRACSLVTKEAADLQPFDAQARADMARVAASTGVIDRGLRSAHVEYDPDTSDVAWGEFSLDGDNLYSYDPGSGRGASGHDSDVWRRVDDD